jgi:poly(beta-D-mannuronate) lyase
VIEGSAMRALLAIAAVAVGCTVPAVESGDFSARARNGRPSSAKTPDSTPVPDVEEAPVPDAPPAPPPAPGSTTVKDHPSDLLDLTIWKLTLPVPGTSASSPREIEDLEGVTVTPFFRLNDARDGVLFRANAGGTTTSGSSYPRSELREMTASGAKASWSTTSGKHTLEIREAILTLPPVKPEVVAGQIHDAEDDVVMIRLESKRLFVEGGGKELALLDAGYSLGKVFVVKIEASGGKIRVSYNGIEALAYTKSASGCYFKAGAYTQSNTSKGDAPGAFGEVVIQDLKVTHQ